MRLRHALAAVLGCALVGAPPAPAQRDDHDRGRTVDVQLVGINDFHGNLEPPSGLVDGRAAGGVEYLATHVARMEADHPGRTVVVSAGDLIGASPLLSALFHDEPTIEAMNELGLDVNAAGNHEFDEGAEELLRMQNGGCHPQDGCLDGDGFGGADLRFLAANVVRTATGRTLFAPYGIKRIGGVKVAFIGETLEGTPQIVTPAGVAGLEFRDEADTINALVPRLRRQGVRTIVALIHEGGVPVADGQCVSGPIRDIVERTSAEVDVFMTGHTHQTYNCVVDGRPVTSAGSSAAFSPTSRSRSIAAAVRRGPSPRTTSSSRATSRGTRRRPRSSSATRRSPARSAPRSSARRRPTSRARRRPRASRRWATSSRTRSWRPRSRRGSAARRSRS
jgi:5'-nucleotidase